jgi:hypothetical protein
MSERCRAAACCKIPCLSQFLTVYLIKSSPSRHDNAQEIAKCLLALSLTTSAHCAEEGGSNGNIPKSRVLEKASP